MKKISPKLFNTLLIIIDLCGIFIKFLHFEILQQDFKLSTLNIIIKSVVPGEFAFEALTANDVYDKEIEFYNNIAPKIKQALKKLNETSQLVAEPYGVCNANNAILFEDLSVKGYSIASVQRGFNFEEAKVVLRKAAMLHAIHAVLQEEDPNIFANFKYGKIVKSQNKSSRFDF